MFSLIGLGTGAAWPFSVIALLWPQLLPAAFKMNGVAPLYFKAAAAITTLVLLGQVLELRARDGVTDVGARYFCWLLDSHGTLTCVRGADV